VTARRGLLLRLAAVPIAALMAYAVSRGASAPTAADGFERALAVVAAAGLAVAAAVAPAAWAVTGAFVLGLFQAHWDLMGVPFSLDRYAMIYVVLVVLVREWRHRDGRLATRPVDWALAVAVLYVVGSAWIGGGLDERAARFDLIDRFGLVPFSVFVVAPYAFRTERDRRVLLGALIAVGAYLSVTAFLETVNANGLIFPHYITDPSKGIHADRARGPFLDAGANGIAMYACAVASAIAFVKWRTRRWRQVAVVVGVMCLLGVVFSLTRVVWLGAAVATPLTLACTRETRRLIAPAFVAVVALVAVCLVAIPGFAGKVEKRRNDNSFTVWARKNSNGAALRMFQDRPVLGFGWGRFAEASPPYYRQAQDYPLSLLPHLHNVYLENTVELGVVGAFLWLAALAFAVGGAILRRGPPELRPWKLGLLAVALAELAGWATAPADYVLPTLLLWLWAGVAWGPREPLQDGRVHDRHAAGELQPAQ
jgi:putative inorganic carbon (hco3(-)) transporter